MTDRRYLVASVLAAVVWLFTSPTIGQDRTAPRSVVIFVDDLHIDFQNTPRLRTGFKQAVERLLAAQRTVAVVSDGAASVSLVPTTDATVLSRFANRLSGGGLKPSETTNPTPTVAADMRRREALAQATVESVLSVADIDAILYVTERQMQPIPATIPVVMTRPEGMEAAVTQLLSVN